MRLIKTILLLLWLSLALLAGPADMARADETGCQATITLLSGEKIKVSQFAVRLLEDAFPGAQLLVFQDDEQLILDLRKLRRLTRLASSGDDKRGQKVGFAFEANDGQTGKVQTWASYIFSGQIAFGSWSERAGNIKQVQIACPPPELSPPASTY